ncbi:MAG TPA: 3'(2'),5'-bisphosphate nucleotidase CysQ [Methylophilaceae bacterium]|jgi:3'(2'), 5'-bisphosphate nucleotidase
MNAVHEHLAQLISIACEAGAAVMQVYRGEIAVTRKDDNSPLTLADIAAHNIIESGLKKLTPELPILSEESANIPYATRATWRRYWLVDPLDGTREFIKRNGEFTVNIALIEAGKPVIGVVFAPAKDLIYYAATGHGAFKQEPDEAVTQVHCRALDLSNLIIAGSRSHSDNRMQTFLGNIERNHLPPQLITMGSSLKICLVAEGKADVYPRLGPTSEWDTAAAQCVLELAGGSLVDMDGQAFTYNTKDSLLNPEFFACGTTQHNWSQYLD